jgi:hypothetical protein
MAQGNLWSHFLLPRTGVMPSFAGQSGRNANADLYLGSCPSAHAGSGSDGKWFERMFGAEIIRSTMLGKPRIDIKLGGAMIFTAQVNPGDGVNSAPTTPYQGLDHFGLAVSGIDAIAADLKKKGVELTQEPHSPHPASKYASCAPTGHFDRIA